MTDAITHLRWAGAVEGLTLLLLVGVGVPLKHGLGWPAFTSVMGPAHGLAFTVYVVLAISVVSAGGWTGRDMARLFVACLVPFGTFLNDSWLKRRSAGPAS